MLEYACNKTFFETVRFDFFKDPLMIVEVECSFINVKT